MALDADATEVQVTFAGNPTNEQRFNLTDFSAISVSLGNGDDRFTEPALILADKSLTVDGGNGNDTINAGDGNDLIFGGNGDDSVDAGRGNDTVILGNGKDFFVWNPGEGSDAVDGGNGSEDVMQFNGANANETMSLSANGSEAVFLRDVAGIRMDMNNIEIFNLTALGGTDTITIDNLEGTSIRHTNIDLSASGGGSDQQADSRHGQGHQPGRPSARHRAKTARSTLQAFRPTPRSPAANRCSTTSRSTPLTATTPSPSTPTSPRSSAWPSTSVPARPEHLHCGKHAPGPPKTGGPGRIVQRAHGIGQLHASATVSGVEICLLGSLEVRDDDGNVGAAAGNAAADVVHRARAAMRRGRCRRPPDRGDLGR